MLSLKSLALAFAAVTAAENGQGTLSAPPTPKSTPAEWYHGAHENVKWAAILDAGSTGTRLHIHEFEYDPYGCNEMGSVSIFVPGWSLKVKPGLADAWTQTMSEETQPISNTSLALDHAIDRYFLPLLDYIKDTLTTEQLHQTVLFFRGTGGIRQLQESDQELLMNFVRRALERWPTVTRPEYSQVISGKHEGVYSWLAANQLGLKLAEEYIMVKLHPRIDQQSLPANSVWRMPAYEREERPRVGLVEMGGASAQVVVEAPPEISDEIFYSEGDYPLDRDESIFTSENGNYEILNFCDASFVLYVMSLDGYGRQAALQNFLRFMISRNSNYSDNNTFFTPCLPPDVRIPLIENNMINERLATTEITANTEHGVTFVQGIREGNGADTCRENVREFLNAFTMPKIPFSVPQDYPIYATENFYYFNQYVNNNDGGFTFTAADFWRKAQQLCDSASSADIKSRIHPDAAQEKQISACFGLVFLSEFLKSAVRIPEMQSLKARTAVKDIETSFTLGVMIVELIRHMGETSTFAPEPYYWGDHDEL